MEENLNNKEIPLSEVLLKYEKKWHTLSNERILKILKTNQNTGLSTKEAQKRLEEFGKNILPKPKKPNIFLIFLKSFLDPLSIMMAIAGITSLIIGLVSNDFQPADKAGLVIVVVIILTNSFIATVQEWKSENQKISLSEKQQKALVLRDGKKTTIDIEELVPGDIIFSKSGDSVPADSRIIDNQLLKVDESALTGENEAVEKVDDIIKEAEIVLGDQKNIAFMSTLVVEGKMVGVVFNTGKESEIGKIASNISESKRVKTPLEKKVTKLTFFIGIVSVILGILIFGVAFSLKNRADFPEDMKSIYKQMLLAVSSAISVIPESLTIIVKICLMVATKKMAKKHVLIKKPKSIESLGNVNVICSDKTGTLTQNKMFVDGLYVHGQEQDLKEYDITNQNDLINCMALCNDAFIGRKKEKVGSATELALIEYLIANKINYLNLRKTNKRLDEIPFDSKRKIMSTVCEVDGNIVAYTKGAMDYLLPNCKHILEGDKVRPIEDKDIENIKSQLMIFAKKGMRTLGLAKKDLKDLDDEFENKLVFIGLVAIIDPPREEVAHSVKEAHDAGVRVIMITGDHKVTAFEIASRLGIADEEHQDVITGQDISTLSEEELRIKLKTTNVFARVNPEHKAMIVDILQADSNIVAMTGDGVNDSPSLVKADVGIAMGITGTEVSKEVSDVILSDDNFKSIISGINSGRNVYEKIKYSISFLVAANISQVLTILLILGIYQTTALNSVNVLFHIFVVETIVAIPIGMQRERSGVMLNPPPTHKKESLLKGIIIQICLTTFFNTLFAVLSYWITHIYLNGQDTKLIHDYAKGGVYIVIMFSPIFYAILFNNRFLPIINAHKVTIVDKYKPNKWLLILMFVAILLTILTMLPFDALNEFFDFKTVDLDICLLLIYILFVALVPICIWSSYRLITYIMCKSQNNSKKIN
ncbi:cation-transporting ATPase [Spiroplasma helicoides]|uniref:Cation-transporting ATPase n=1 Tax=Spiroplasma helicoides TaxID=216938 RepID=A0A1B3SJH3_9MOLU|nr:cation-translocating P-type ATPase [Spiroplasma helicoides]AOG60084.1 cation-transporting ATPase [Spiroplasma helicoides]